MRNKGLSGIISTVIMIGLVLAAVTIVWGVVNTMITDQTEGASACFNNFNKVVINTYYTCYNSITDEVEVSIDVADVEVDEVIVSVYSDRSRATFNVPGTYANVKNYNGVYNELLTKIPANSGKTYVVSNMTESPDIIQLAPVISGKQCEISDKITSVIECA